MQHKEPSQSTHLAKPAKQPQSTIVIDLSEDDEMTDASPVRPASKLLGPQRPQHATHVQAEPKKALDPVDDLTKRFAALKSPTQTASRFPKDALNPNPTIRRALNGRAPSPLRSSAITIDKAPERPAPLVFSDADMPKSTQPFRPVQPRPVADPLKTSSLQPQHLTLPPLDRPHQKPQFKDLPHQSQPQQKVVSQQLQQQPQQRKPQSIQSLYHQQFVQQKQQVNNDKKLVVPTYNSSRLMVIDNNPLPIFAASTAKRDIPKVTTTAPLQPHNIFSLSSTSASSSITLAASSSRTTTVVNATSNNTPSSAFDVATLSERLYQQIQKQEVVKAVPTAATKEKPKKKGKEKNKREKEDDEDVSDEEEDSEEEDEAAEQFKQPKDLLVKLLPYQMTALKWMLHNESAESETKG